MAHILLVEDSQIAALLVKNMLESMQCSVVHAENGQAALTAASNQDFDLILMDIGLPDESGLEVTKKIRALTNKDRASVPIVAVTAHMQDDMLMDCLSVGMQGMHTKPLTKAAASKLLKEFLHDNATEGINSSVSKDVHTELPAIDLEMGLKLFNGNKKNWLNVFAVLMQDLTSDEKAITTAFCAKNYQLMYDKMHKFYGGVCYCGVPRLQDVTRSIKEALINKQYDELAVLMPQFHAAIAQLQEEYKQFDTK